MNKKMQPDYYSLSTIFDRQCFIAPAKPAIIEGGDVLSFIQLESWAARIAAALTAEGLKKGQRVAVYLPRGGAAVASILAIMKLGAVYVPISRNLPSERAEFILKDAGINIIMMGGDNAPFSVADLRKMDPARYRAGIEQVFPSVPVDPEDDCWILYTSGSTGHPKGVRGKHAACINRIVWMWESQPFYENEVCYQNTALSTVDSFWEIFAPLGKGYPLLVIADEVTESPTDLVKTLENTDIRRICLVPSLLSSMLWIYPDLGQRLPQVELWVVSGEALSPDLARRFYEAHPQARLINQYGLTESCADVTYYDTAQIRDTLLHGDLGDLPPRIFIGKPISRVQAHIVNDEGLFVSAGEPGELVISGVAVSNGYLNREQEEAERFGVMTLPDGTTARILRTGDLARILPDGQIEHMGRKDSQLKIRGFRVEVSEVETMLRRYPGVKEAIVFPLLDDPEDISLVAVFDHCDAATDLSAIRAWMEQKLPSYMWPSKYILELNIPRTPTGKVDKGGLRYKLGFSGQQTVALKPADDEMLRDIAQIWSKVLMRDSIEPDDDFYELGGHSLKAARIFSSISKETGIVLPLSDILNLRTVRKMADRIAALRGQPTEPASPQAAVDALPLSVAQRRLWFLQRLEPESAAYNLGFCVVLKGVVLPERIFQALQMVARRQPILRACIAEKDGVPFFQMQEDASIPMTVKDITNLPTDCRDDFLKSASREVGQQPFDISSAPLARGLLVRVAENEHRLYICAHHLICDGWAANVLNADLMEALRLMTQGVADMPALTPASIIVTGADIQVSGEKLKRYWVDYLAGMPNTLDLPRLANNVGVLPWVGGQKKIIFTEGLSRDISAFSADRGCSPSALFLAGFSVLLRRMTGQDVIGVCLPVTTRHNLELGEGINFLIDTVFLKIDVGGNITLNRMVRRVQDETAEALLHMPMPLEKIVADLDLNREKKRSPLVDLEFTYQEKLNDIETANIKSSLETTDSGVCRFDLSLGVRELERGYEICLDFAADSFDPDFIADMLGYYRQMLETLVGAPDAPCGEVAYLTKHQQEKAIFMGEVLPPQAWQSIPGFFFEAAKAHPERMALKRGSESCTYGVLSAKIQALVHALHAGGIKNGKRIAIVLPRSIDIPWAILGALSSGAAYCLIDPATPPARIERILNLVRPDLILTNRATLTALQTGVAKSLCLDDIALARTVTSEALPEWHHIGPAQEATVQFTSGSTGFPKGIIVTHENLAAYRSAILAVTGDADHSRWLAVSNVSFDIAFTELILPLTLGGTVFVADSPNTVAADGVGDPFRILEKENISHLQCTPSLMRLFLENDATAKKLDALDRVLVGGEALTSDLALRILNTGVKILWNVYGPTETTIWSAACRIELNDRRGVDVYLGRPLAGENLYILDAALQPVTAGMTGEIFIGGVGVTNGYLNDEAQTREKFLPDPYCREPGRGMYRTGDHAKITASGEIEFMGRRDFQVKIRGHRIEMGDIETAIERHKLVSAAACRVQSGPGDVPLIAAHVVAEKGAALSVEDVRAFLASELPAYMMPTFIVITPVLPVSPRGKIDRSALPVLTGAGTTTEDATSGGEIEDVVASIWAELLEIPLAGVDRTKTFLSSGGHSLLATRLVSRIGQKLNVNVPLISIMANPSIKMLTAIITENISSQQDQPRYELQKMSGALRPSLNQERMWFIDQLNHGSPFLNIQAGLWLTGELDTRILQMTLNEVLKNEDVFRVSFHQNDLDDLGIELMNPNPVSIHETDVRSHSRRAAAVAMDMAAKFSRQPFDLKDPPFFRANLYRTGDNEWLFSITIHHIIADTWSLGILLKKMASTYDSLRRTGRAPIPAYSMSYIDYSDWERAQLTTDAAEKERTYWKAALADPLPILELPLDHARPSRRAFAGAQHSFSLGHDLATQIHDTAQRAQATVFIVLLAAYSVFLKHVTRQNDFIIGTAAAPRRHPDVENTVGLFVNTLPIRMSVGNDDMTDDILYRARRAFSEAVSHQALPFEQILALTKTGKRKKRQDLFSTMLVLQNAPWPESLSLSGLVIEPMTIDLGFSQYDLTLYVDEQKNGFDLIFEYDTALFNKETIARFESSFIEILKLCVRESRPVHDIQALPTGDISKILSWQDTAAPIDPSFSDLLDAAFRENLNGQAIVYGEDSISYAVLKRRVASLAAALREKGVGKGDIVCAMLERSPQLAISMLAIIAVGACYCPVDPSYPKARRDLILKEAKPKLLLTDLPAAEYLEINVLDPFHVKETDFTFKPVPTGKDSSVALIFTSGSTGIPKGVLLPASGILNRISWGRVKYPYERGDICVSRTPVGFVDSLAEILAPLLSGATLRIYPDKEVQDIQYFVKSLAHHRVSRATFTPSMLDAVLEELRESPEDLSHLKTLFLSGETLRSATAANWASIFPATKIVNVYGCTECCADSTYHEYNSSDASNYLVPIGGPIHNTGIYILNDQDALCGIGIVGDICIGGEGLSIGYINSQAVPDPPFFTPPPHIGAGTRLYRTGDLGCYRSDGTVEFHGRKGSIVKIRGMRVELPEIEAILIASGLVKNAVVITDPQAEERIVAFVVPQDKDSQWMPLVHQSLAQRLPAGLMPTVIISYDEFPINSSGKIDRRALTESIGHRNQGGQDVIKTVMAASANQNENDGSLHALLRQAWEQVLSVSDINDASDFFMLGGHSLLAAKLVARLRRATGADIPLEAIFEHSGFGAMRTYLQQRVLPGRHTAFDILSDLIDEMEGDAQPGPTEAAVDFSLFFFPAGIEKDPTDLYRLFLESASMADQIGLKAVWTPERHFHQVGGQFPNPSVLGAALAVATKNVAIRAGSVVLPLHNPIRVVEEWAVVDNLSKGRVGVSFASGWNPKDFAFFPDNYSARHKIMSDGVMQVQSLWSGNTAVITDGNGHESEVHIFPRPLQKELPVWVTSSGAVETFIEAGKLGANLLTHLLGQTKEDLAQKIASYFSALRESGHDPKTKTVTLMLHTFLSENVESAIETSRGPFSDYLRAFMSLQNLAATFGKTQQHATKEEMDAIIHLAFERYARTASLIGDVETCALFVRELYDMGVTEIACLIDFGIEESQVLRGLPLIRELQDKVTAAISDKKLIRA